MHKNMDHPTVSVSLFAIHPTNLITHKNRKILHRLAVIEKKKKNIFSKKKFGVILQISRILLICMINPFLLATIKIENS